jgi:photosystem II stability/assembly factor-like uncharacterized protein
LRTVVASATLILLLGLILRTTAALQGTETVTPLDSIHMIDSHGGWAMTYCGSCSIGTMWGLFHTTNGGEVWEDVRPVDSAGRRIEAYFLYANSDVAWAQRGQLTNAQQGKLTETDGLLRSTDGGRTWKGIPLPAVSGVTRAVGVTSISFINAREGWLLASVASFTSKEAVAAYRSTDGGETWTVVAAHQFYSDGSVGGGNGIGLVGNKNSITFFNSTTGLITIGSLPYAAWKPFVYVTQDGGSTWGEQNLSVPPPLYTRHLQSPLPDVSSKWQSSQWPPKVFTGKNGIVRVDYWNTYTGIPQLIKPMAVFYITHDGSAMWTHTTPLPLDPGPWGAVATDEGVYSVADARFQPSDFADLNYGWLADHDTLYATTNRGHEWTRVRTIGFPVANQLNFISQQVGWAIRKVGSETKPVPASLFKTVDGGRTWTPVTYAISQR